MSLIIVAGVLLTACEQPPTPIVLSEAEATQRALPSVSTLPAANGPVADLRMVVSGWQGLDPMRFGDVASIQVQALLYEPLLAHDENGALQPLLAETLPVVSQDGLTWTVPLQAGMMFHDEIPVDGAQVATSMNRLLEAVEYDGTMPVQVFVFQQVVASVSASDRELTFHLHEPFANFPYLLASPALAVVREGGAGTGPYMIQENTETDSGLHFVPNPAYHGGKPSAGGVTVTLLEPGDPVTAVQDADMLVWTGASPEQVPAEFVAVNGHPQQQWLLVDTSVPPLDRGTVQQAFSTIADDPALALELFANAQLPDGFDLVVWQMLPDEVWEIVGTRFEAGPVNIERHPVNWERLALRSTREGDMPGAYLLAWDQDWLGQWWTDWLGGTASGETTMSGVLLATEARTVYLHGSLAGLGVMDGSLPRITAYTHRQSPSAGGAP